MSSIANRSGVIHFDDMQSERQYKPMVAYVQSKLACLMFSLELQRRSDAAGWGISGIAAPWNLKNGINPQRLREEQSGN